MRRRLPEETAKSIWLTLGVGTPTGAAAEERAIDTIATAVHRKAVSIEQGKLDKARDDNMPHSYAA